MFERVDAIIQEGLTDGHYSGVAVGIAQAGKTLHTSYAGRVAFEADSPAIERGTLFDLASVTKIASTTMIALRFIDRGYLRLEDKVSDFFPDATTSADLTIRQLLTHTSGQPAHFLLEQELDDPAGIRELMLHRPLAYTPGERVEYSCMGFILLGEILQHRSQRSLSELLASEVTGPLGLEYLQYAPVDPAQYRIAQTKDLSSGQRLEGIVHDENARFQHGVSANAGLFSNLEDLLSFGSMLAQGGRVNGEAYLSPAVLRTATRNYTAAHDEHRGLGFFLGSTQGSSLGDLCGDAAYGHTGFTGTSLLVVPEYELAVAFLSNRVLSDNDSRATVRVRSLVHNAVVASVSCRA